MKKIVSTALSTLILGAVSLPALAVTGGSSGCGVPGAPCDVPQPQSIALALVGLVAAVAVKRFGKRK